MSTTLPEYLEEYANLEPCECKKCKDRNHALPDNTGHTADVLFHQISANKGAYKHTLAKLIREYADQFKLCDPLDGERHDHHELEKWLGTHDMALKLMGLGAVLGLFNLTTPRTILPAKHNVPLKLAKIMSEKGFLYITALPMLQPKPAPAPTPTQLEPPAPATPPPPAPETKPPQP